MFVLFTFLSGQIIAHRLTVRRKSVSIRPRREKVAIDVVIDAALIVPPQSVRHGVGRLVLSAPAA